MRICVLFYILLTETTTVQEKFITTLKIVTFPVSTQFQTPLMNTAGQRQGSEFHLYTKPM